MEHEHEHEGPNGRARYYIVAGRFSPESEMLAVESARPIDAPPSLSEEDSTLVLAEVAVSEVAVPLRRPPRRGDTLQVVTRYREGGRLRAIALPPAVPAMVDVVLRTKDGWETTVTVPAVHADDARRMVLWFCTEPRLAGLFSARLALQMGKRLEVEVGAQPDGGRLRRRQGSPNGRARYIVAGRLNRESEVLVVESARPIGTPPSPSEEDSTLALAEVAVPEVPARRPPRRGDALQVVMWYRGGGRMWAIVLPPVVPAMVDVVLRTKDGWETTVTVPAVHADDTRRIVLWFCTEPGLAGLFSARLALQMGEPIEVEVGGCVATYAPQAEHGSAAARSDDAAAAGEGER